MNKEHGEIEKTLVDHLQSLLHELELDQSYFTHKITQHILSLVTQDQNVAPMRSISQEEVDFTLHEIPLGKSPSLDGFTSNFFIFYWHLIKEEVQMLLEDSHKSLLVLTTLNAIFIILITKEDKASILDKFRPIFICNVI